MANFTPEVTQWLALTRDLIAAAGDYAASGVEDPDISAMMRAIQVNTAALNAAMQAVQLGKIPLAPQHPFDAPAPRINPPIMNAKPDDKPQS